jgi:hypothetical protein
LRRRERESGPIRRPQLSLEFVDSLSETTLLEFGERAHTGSTSRLIGRQLSANSARARGSLTAVDEPLRPDEVANERLLALIEDRTANRLG